MTSRSGITIFAVLAIAALLAAPALAETPVATATFKCQGGKSIEATFYANSVNLKLSDVRSLTVPQAMSASGVALRQQGRDLRVLEQGRHRLRHRRQGRQGNLFRLRHQVR